MNKARVDVSVPSKQGVTSSSRGARLRERRGTLAGRSAFRPHVAVLLPNGPRRALLLGGLGKGVRVTLLEQDNALTGLLAVDVALLHADSLTLACGPLLHDPRLGLPELVFVVDDAWSPQHFALKSRGFRHVVSQDELPEWLPGALMSLSALARARRIVLDACADTPTAAALSARSRRAGGVKLHAAETSFRDVFMRSLLAEHGSRRKAAEEAGVPYRSFCEMLRKLGI